MYAADENSSATVWSWFGIHARAWILSTLLHSQCAHWQLLSTQLPSSVMVV